MTLAISSTAFDDGGAIPRQYSCMGAGISPPLSWSGAPAATQSMALVLDDPDAPGGTFVHWVIYNIPASSAGLAEAVPGDARLADGTLQGMNSARRTGYSPPCPPSGTHHYFFKLYAVDTMLSLGAGAGKQELLKAMQGHIVAQGELMGTFTR